MLVTWTPPGTSSTEIAFEEPDYTGANPDLLGKIPVDYVTVKAPGQDGEGLLDSPLAARGAVTLEYVAHADTAADLAALLRTVSRAFSPRGGPGTLKIVMDDGEIFYLSAVVKTGNPIYLTSQEDRSSTGDGLSDYWQRFRVTLIAYSPWWYSDEESNRYLPWTGITIPFEIPFDIGTYSDGNTIDNIGDLDCPVRLQIAGPMINPRLTNVTTGEFIELTKSLVAGQELYIDTAFGNITCVIRDASTREFIGNAFPYVSIDTTWFWLVPGENVIRFESDDANDGSNLLLSWTPRHSAV